jgi:hypothetical protein
VFQSLEVRRVKLWRRLSPRLEHGENMFVEHHPDGMDRIMPAEPLPTEPIKRLDNDFFTQGDLVLDNNVDRGVKPGVRQRNATPTMIRYDHFESFALWRLQPFSFVRSNFGIVSLHDPPFLVSVRECLHLGVSHAPGGDTFTVL